MANMRVTSVTETRLNSKPYVPTTTFGRATLGANSVVNKLFLTFLFGDPDVGVQFLMDEVILTDDNRCQHCRESHDQLCCGRNQSHDGNFTVCGHS
jgi:hypothetical protein